MKNSSFALLSNEERMEKLIRTIRARTGDILGSKEIQSIKEHVDVNKQYEIEIIYTPAEFNRSLTLKNINENGRKTIDKGIKVFGNYLFGQRETEYQKGCFAGGKIKKACLLEMTNPAAAIVHTSNLGYNDMSIPLDEDKIVIYIPETAASRKKAG